MLMKLTTGVFLRLNINIQPQKYTYLSIKPEIAKNITLVNFINILQAAFTPIFFCQKISKPNSNQ